MSANTSWGKAIQTDDNSTVRIGKRMKKLNVAINALLALIIVLIFDPSGSTLGARDVDEYTPIRNILADEHSKRVITLASWDDLYEVESEQIARKEISLSYTEYGQIKILDAASLGDEFFNSYLNENKISHVVVPVKSSKNNLVFHKWGDRGSIEIHLIEPYFTKLISSFGEHGVSLYRVNRVDKSIEIPKNFHYELKWSDNVRPEFHKKLIKFKEIGMYAYSYHYSYEDGPDVSWVFQYSDMQKESADFTFQSHENANQKYEIEITLLAAYGPKAPSQIALVSLNSGTKPVQFNAGEQAKVLLTVVSNDRITIRNVLPCRSPSTWEPSDQDRRKFCFGIGKITVRRLLN
jgi:hypothetical protein